MGKNTVYFYFSLPAKMFNVHAGSFCRVLRLEVQVYIYDTFFPTQDSKLIIDGNQGNEWKHAQVDININNRHRNVKIQVTIIILQSRSPQDTCT